jgi:hypothetical protein
VSRVSGRTAASKLRHLVINLDREVLGGWCGLGRVAAFTSTGVVYGAPAQF